MHLTRELDDQSAARVDAAAKNTSLPPDKSIERLSAQSTADWPASVKALIGAWCDEPWPEQD
ncbi:MAG: CopG family transcriptional regulator [Candidatus Competibacteraceae bacterium]